MHSGHTEPKGKAKGEGEDAERPEHFDGPHSLAHAEPCSQERAQTGWSGWSGRQCVRTRKDGCRVHAVVTLIEITQTEDIMIPVHTVKHDLALA